jgi:hypothetical protein
MKDYAEMSELEQKIRLGIGSAAAAAAIFAPVGYKGKGILTGIAAGALLTGIYRKAPIRGVLGF